MNKFLLSFAAVAVAVLSFGSATVADVPSPCTYTNVLSALGGIGGINSDLNAATGFLGQADARVTQGWDIVADVWEKIYEMSAQGCASEVAAAEAAIEAVEQDLQQISADSSGLAAQIAQNEATSDDLLDDADDCYNNGNYPSCMTSICNQVGTLRDSTDGVLSSADALVDEAANAKLDAQDIWDSIKDLECDYDPYGGGGY